MNTKDSSNQIDMEQLLQDGNILKLKPQGYSMYPLFIPGRDEALIQQAALESLRKNDVVLYRRDHSILVLHRICRIAPEGIYMVGDNQSEVEGPLRPDQIRGKLVGFIRNGKNFSVKNPLYRFLSFLWLTMLPIRPVCFWLTALLRRLLQHAPFCIRFPLPFAHPPEPLPFLFHIHGSPDQPALPQKLPDLHADK